MKEKFIKSTIILIIGGFITKILGMVIRIVITRLIGVSGIGLYMLILPTFNLFMTISSLSLATSISKIVAEERGDNRNIVLGVIPIAMIFNITIIVLITLLAPFIAKYLLQNNDLYYPILATCFTLPFITLSGIARGYFFGKQKMFPHVISHIFEQVIRTIIILLITPFLLSKGITFAVTGLILSNIVSEIASIIILFLFLPKNFKLKKENLKYNSNNLKDVFAISIPTTLGRLISALGMFLEPIIITFVLINLGYNNNYITSEYGTISGYVLPMVMMPAFLSGAVSNALLPIITKYYKLKKIDLVKQKIKQAIFISLAIGIPFTIILMIFPEFCLNLIFNTTKGSSLLRIAAPIFLFSYVQGPIASSLQAMNKSKELMKSSVIAIIFKTITLFLLLYLNIGMLAILIAYAVLILYEVIHSAIILKKTTS